MHTSIVIIGIGVDLIDIQRFKRLESSFVSFSKSLFTPDEMELSVRSRAGNLALKEGLIKAGFLASHKQFRHITITRNFGSPILQSVDTSIINAMGQLKLSLSISYSKEIACGLVVIESNI